MPEYPIHLVSIDSISEIPLEPDYDYNRLKRGYMEGIYPVMSDSPRFQKVVKADTVYEFLLSTGQISWDELRQICTRDSTDAVLILKKAVSHDLLAKIRHSRHTLRDFVSDDQPDQMVVLSALSGKGIREHYFLLTPPFLTREMKIVSPLT